MIILFDIAALKSDHKSERSTKLENKLDAQLFPNMIKKEHGPKVVLAGYVEQH